jgi:hypothetical protein
MGDVVLHRQRSLLALGERGPIEGWMDEDVASAATQLFGSGPRGLLVIDARELLTSTARVVGAQFGELHFKVWMALITLHVAQGMPQEGRGTSTVGELGRMIWGEDRARGGSNTRKLVRALMDLTQAQFTVPGYDIVNQRPASGVSNTSLLINLYVDAAILRAYDSEPGAERLARSEFGKALGGKRRGTIAWRMHPDYTQRLGAAELRRFDWVKAQQLRGVALALWMVFTSPRVPYRQVLETAGDLEMVDVLLTQEHCQALGVHNSADAGRRRTLNEAGRRVCAADRSFKAFETHGGRGRDSFLRIIRHRPAEPPVDRPFDCPGPGQLTLVP